MSDGPFECDTCGKTVPFDAARRTKTTGGLEPTKWQTLCCPHCGTRLKTVFVGETAGTVRAAAAVSDNLSAA